MSKATEILADYVTKINLKDIPPRVRHESKRRILDFIGVTLAGSRKIESKIVVDLVRDLGGTKEATIIGYGDKTSSSSAALANGVMSHVLELDDWHEKALYHIASTVLPAALAVAERQEADGKSLMTAIVLGYDIGMRIGRAINVNTFSHRMRGFHTTGTVGPFGAAAAAGKILDLDKNEMISAFGLAGTQSAGLLEFLTDGTFSKRLNPGRAAQSGVLAALLAQRGFTGPTKILEGSRGFCRAFSDEYELAKLTEELGKRYEIIEANIKVHAACGLLHTSCDALLNIMHEHKITADDIDRIVVETIRHAVDGHDETEPKTAVAATMSLPYVMAATAVAGKCGLSEFTNESLRNPKILSLAKKVTCKIDPEARQSAKVEVIMNDGKKYISRVNVARGFYPENALSDKELEDKFENCASLVLDHEKISEIIYTVKKLESTTDVRDLTGLLFSK